MENVIELASEFSRVAVTKYRIRDVKTNTFFNDNKQGTYHGTISHLQQQQNSWELTQQEMDKIYAKKTERPLERNLG